MTSGRIRRDRSERRRPAVRDHDVVAVVQIFAHDLGQLGLVVDEQQSLHDAIPPFLSRGCARNAGAIKGLPFRQAPFAGQFTAPPP